MEEIGDGDVTWRFADVEFLRSNWTCIWGRGCLGIHDVPAPELGDGCCSVGAVLDGVDEAMTISALAATIAEERFQFHEEAAAGGVFADPEGRTATRVIDGACIFLNRPGFAGGAGCALHVEALAVGESPLEWKPSVCWQLPIKVDWEDAGDGREIATVRRWSRADWGDEGETMAWCCTEGEGDTSAQGSDTSARGLDTSAQGSDTGARGSDTSAQGSDTSARGWAYVGDRPVVESLGEELAAVVGTEVYVELRRRLG